MSNTTTGNSVDDPYSPGAELFIYPLVALFGANTLLFLSVQICLKRDNSWIDAMWGMCFCIPNVVILALRGQAMITGRMLMITIPVFTWGVRLAQYIVRRHKSEDYRYKEMREGWEKSGKCGYFAQAYIYVYLMQGCFSILINASVLYVNIWSHPVTSKGIQWSDFVGLAIWTIGFLFEVVADAQLAEHLKNPKQGTGKFIKSGLWRYSRHPNYFGESVMWTGLWIITLQEEYGWATFFSPVFMTLLIRFVSGVPFPEKKYANNAEFQQYCRETNCFVPWFYKDEATSKVRQSDQEMVASSQAQVNKVDGNHLQNEEYYA